MNEGSPDEAGHPVTKNKTRKVSLDIFQDVKQLARAQFIHLTLKVVNSEQSIYSRFD